MADLTRRDQLAGGLGDGIDDTGPLGDWNAEESYWRTNWSTRPYATGDLGFDHYLGGYRYGYEAARLHRGRAWNDVEGDLRSGWDRYEHRNAASWEAVKDAVRDAFERISKRG